LRKIAVLVVDRANYGRLKPVMEHLRSDPTVDLNVICAGTMLLERFGKVVDIVRADDFKVSSEIYMELEGSIPTTMAKSLGLAIMEFTNEFHRLKPDTLVVIGDRYEALAATISAAYLNICITHLQGGEVSGSIDESARHAITKFAHYHFPATERAKEYIIRMGEHSERVFNLGCPVVDVISNINMQLPADIFAQGVGVPVDPHKPYLLVIYHPVTTEFDKACLEVDALLEVLEKINHPTIWLWPNIDAGSEYISKKLRTYREDSQNSFIRLVKNFPPEKFQAVLANATCAIGNSSSFVRDSSFTGTPVVLMRARQIGRETGPNVISVESADPQELSKAVMYQIDHGRYETSSIYGAPGASLKIARKISELEPVHKKYLSYINE
jgi:UDP-hydrolysing UDP-N-acetyl-D-glucosamine 2-epimerase